MTGDLQRLYVLFVFYTFMSLTSQTVLIISNSLELKENTENKYRISNYIQSWRLFVKLIEMKYPGCINRITH